MNLSFKNKVALVTGAGSGMGLATAKAFTEGGAAVALADIDEETVRSATEELVAAGQHQRRVSRTIDTAMVADMLPRNQVP
jgi:NAD(P)-dependent dehydrogenase (short-subunit alcohol dehydrogenase family)